MLHGVQVDAERNLVTVLESAPASHRPFGTGEWATLMMRMRYVR